MCDDSSVNKPDTVDPIDIFAPICILLGVAFVAAAVKGCHLDRCQADIATQAIESGYEQTVVEGQVVWRKTVEEKTE
jgi:hypothetical protein